jgi:type II secretory pathway component GspD/PulD (secretin)
VGGGGGNNNNGGVPIPTAKSGLVVMRGTRETLTAVQSLIAKIDKPPKQMALKVKIYQTSVEPEEVYGLLRATAQNERLQAAYELGSLSFNILSRQGVDLPEDYTAAFDALSQQRKVKLITETEIATLDGFQATIQNNRTRGQLSGTLVITPDGQVINQPNFNPVTVGTQLTFTPQIDDRGRITMFLNINLTNFDGPEQVASANGQQVTFQPTVQTNVQTTLRIADGQTILIGGLTTSEDSVSFSGVPFLSKLPIIGQFFGRTERDRNQSQIFITLQGNIIDDK